MADNFSVMALSMQADLHKINASSQNIANANTPAYKRHVSFSSWLNQSTPYTSTIVDRSHGIMNLTNDPFDIALSGNGYFVVSEDGQDLITRNGSFAVNAEGFLVSSEGLHVQSERGDIFIGDQPLSVNKDGEVLIAGEVSAKFKIVQLSDHAKLIPSGQNTFKLFDQDISQEPSTPYSLHQGYLETSNVDTRLEMLNLVETMRHFELQQKVLRSYNSVIDVGITDLGSF